MREAWLVEPQMMEAWLVEPQMMEAWLVESRREAKTLSGHLREESVSGQMELRIHL